MPDNLQPHAVWIGKAEHLLLEPLARAFRSNPGAQQTLFPELQRRAGNAECGGRSLAYPLAAARGMGPGEEGKDGPRGPGIVAKVEVVGPGIVKVDGALYEAEPQHFGIEIQIPLRVRSNRGDVVQANNGFWHEIASNRV